MPYRWRIWTDPNHDRLVNHVEEVDKKVEGLQKKITEIRTSVPALKRLVERMRNECYWHWNGK